MIEDDSGDYVTIEDFQALQAKYNDLYERYGDIEQSLSDNTFHMSKLFDRLCKVFELEPMNTTWFELVDRVEATFKEANKP